MSPNPQFTEANFRELLEAIQDRAGSFNHNSKRNEAGTLGWADRAIFLRFDIDNDFRKSFEASCICNEYGIRATFFILNTAPYWRDASLMRFLNEMQNKGHEIAWHNNALAQWIGAGDGKHDASLMYHLVMKPIDEMRSAGLNIIGSASHGDPLCRKLGFINYEIFEECPRTSEADGFPKPSFDFPRVKMADFGLEYEAYHVPYDLYLSESGGQGWLARKHKEPKDITSVWPWAISEENLSLFDQDNRIQILIHPQHWKI